MRFPSKGLHSFLSNKIISSDHGVVFVSTESGLLGQENSIKVVLRICCWFGEDFHRYRLDIRLPVHS